MSMIRVENLKKSFGDLEVIKDMSTVVEEKEVICVIGPSGSGKSTFLRCLNRSIHKWAPQRGQAFAHVR